MENTRPRLAYNRVQRRRVAADDNTFLKKTIKQFVVCIIIAALIFAMSRINFPSSKMIIDNVKSSVSYTIDYKATAISIYESVKKLIYKNEQSTQESSEGNLEESTDAQTN